MKLKIADEHLYFGQKTKETCQGDAKKDFCTNHCVLQNYHSSGECPKSGHFLNKQHEFCARERCQIDSPRD